MSPKAHEALRVLVFDDYNKATLEADLTGRYNALSFSTALHGGFRDCRLTIPMDMGEAWLWLNKERLPGRHFHHLEITEDKRVVWEGRLMDFELRVEAGFYGLDMTAFGYWNSMRDQYYDPDDVGNTNWQTGGPWVVSDVIKEMITNECPDINGTAGITANTRNISGLNITVRSYPMDHIVDSLAPLSDSGTGAWYFGVWDSRKPTWTARAVSQVDWYVWLRDIRNLRLRQQAEHLRNYVLPIVGTAEGTGAVNADSTANYPRREIMVNLPLGVSGTVANEARDMALAERNLPRQDEEFTIDGHVYSTAASGLVAAGAMVERPKWWVRAGQVLRIQDLVPASAATPSLDDLRTFYLLETQYDAINDILTVQPDRPPSRLGLLLSRLGQMEADR